MGKLVIGFAPTRRFTFSAEDAMKYKKLIRSFMDNYDIEIIDITYFTRLIRTGEFGVSGHFRVQYFGTGNNEAKIIFIDSYKKNGYSRGAKIDNK